MLSSGPTPKRGLVGWLVLGLVLMGVLYWFPPGQHRFYPPCLWKLWTGWECPSCGFLRAGHLLLHGEWMQAWRMNPLLFLYMGWFLSTTIWWAWMRWRRRQDADNPWMRPMPLLILVLVSVGYGVFRNLN